MNRQIHYAERNVEQREPPSLGEFCPLWQGLGQDTLPKEHDGRKDWEVGESCPPSEEG